MNFHLKKLKYMILTRMGLFNKLFSGASTPTIQLASEAEAVFAVIYSCMASDGDIGDGELTSLVNYGNNNRLLSRLDLVGTYRRMGDFKRKVGISGLVSAALPLISSERRPTVFAVAVDFMLADGVVGPKEQELLADLQKGLSISDDQATQIIEVLLIKNK